MCKASIGKRNQGDSKLKWLRSLGRADSNAKPVQPAKNEVRRAGTDKNTARLSRYFEAVELTY